TIWKSAGDGVARKYAFTYDNVNRLTGADFNQDNGSSFDKSAKIDFSVSGLSYDANGNIGSMKQVGFKVGGSGTIDSLIYSYLNNGASNKLLRVVDSADDQNSKLGDFHYNPTTKGTTDYIYDGNGSLMVDNNKGINYMSYNYLNLPQSIPVNGKGNISYIYDAAGNKLVKTTVDSTSTPVKTTITTYMAGFVYVNDTLQFMGEEESRARWAFHKYTNGTTGYGFEHDFFEKDHLGNTRVLLTQQKDTAQYVATMEGAYRATENALFYNIPATNYPRASAPGYPVDYSVTNPNDSVARVNGSGPKVGPAIILKVMSGDKVDIGANYYYNASTATNGQSLSASDIINSLAAGIVSMTGGVHGSLADLTGGSSPLPAGLSSFISSKDVTTAGKPNAYLNWILLDDQFNYVSSYPQSGALQVGPSGTATGGGLQTPLGYKGISITKSGYLYIYVSNATPSWDVFFDNLSVTTYSGPMLEETHYYPFGLTMAGISDKTLKTQYAENKYRFNDGTELQNKEFSDGSGLELYETDYRGYDPQIGRLWQIDPLGDINESYSPYSFSNDNPILLNDPLGLANDTTTLPTVTVTHPFNPLPSTPTAVTTGLADTQGGAPDVSGSVGSAPTSTADPINSGSSGETAATTDKRTLFEKFDQNETLGNILDAINSFNPLAKGVDLGSTIFTGHDHRGVQQSVGQATLNFAVTIPAGRLSGTITNVAANIGLAEVRQGIAKTFTVANDMAHILASKHNLSLLLPMAGSEANIIRRLYLSLGQSGSLPASGVFERVVNIYGHDVTIRGAVVNGIPRISTAFIP
ncbi:MAG TPA: RHS repeat-associated core domain-containing protein, partial [Puia sp.]